MLSILRALNPGYVAPSAKNTMSQDKASSGECSLPSELLGAVFSYLTLRELLQCRHASQLFKQLVDTEAKLRMVDFVSDPDHTLVMQAGPPALFDVCEYLTLSLSHFGAEPGYLTSPPLLATMAVSHQPENPSHRTNMGADDTQFFQNLVVSVSQMQCKRDRHQASFSRMLGGWDSWEVTRENDRLWRHWWDDAPLATTSATSVESNDSGFSEASIFGSEVKKPLKQALDIGQTVHRGILDLSKSEQGGLVHEYRWEAVDLDVFRTIIAKEDREIRSGLRAVVGRTMVVL